jgi:hypothetical protein
VLLNQFRLKFVILDFMRGYWPIIPSVIATARNTQ